MSLARAATIVVLIAAGACRSGGTPAPAASPSRASTANHPPKVRALCDPCTVPAGRAVTLNADAQDADGDTLTYMWTAPSGAAAAASSKQTTWTAPSTAGPVPITVRVSDGKGGIASDVITITVTK
jgi:hypothetical protein